LVCGSPDQLDQWGVGQLGIFLSTLAVAVEVFCRSVKTKAILAIFVYPAADPAIKNGNQNELRHCISE